MTTDEVLDSGQKIQRSGVATLKVSRPDRLRADVASDRSNEQLFYDGKTFTIYQPALGYYGSFNAPPTLAQLVNEAEQHYGIDMPLADLFAWGTDQTLTANLKGATNLGPSMVKGVKCDHYAFRRADVDWEVWIQQGPQPLPRKWVITTTTEKHPTAARRGADLGSHAAPRRIIVHVRAAGHRTAHRVRRRTHAGGGGRRPSPRGQSWPEPEPIVVRKVNYEHAESQVSRPHWNPGRRARAGRRQLARATVRERHHRRAHGGGLPPASGGARGRRHHGGRRNRGRRRGHRSIRCRRSCSSVMVGNVAYQQCGSTWYQPRYAGSDVTYVVVSPPR